MAYSSFEYGEDTPTGWAPEVYRGQERLGPGAAAKYGPRPPTADEVAPRGTPAWRAAWQRMHDWVQKQIFSGATLADMGFTREHEHGKQHFLKLQRGEYGGFRRDWMDGARGHGRLYIDPYTGMTRPIAGTGGPFGGPESLNAGAAPPPPQTGLRSAGAPTAPFAAPTRPYAPAAPMTAPGATASSAPSFTASDSYMQNPRGGRKKFSGIMPGQYTPSATLIRKRVNG